MDLTSTSCARIKVISAVLLSESPVCVHVHLWSSPRCSPSSHDELVSMGLAQHHNEALELSSGAITPFHNDHESMELYRCPVEELIMGNMSHSGNRLKTYHLPGEYSAMSLSRQLFGSIQWKPVLHNNAPQGASDETSWALGMPLTKGLSFTGEEPDCRAGQTLAEFFFFFFWCSFYSFFLSFSLFFYFMPLTLA